MSEFNAVELHILVISCFMGSDIYTLDKICKCSFFHIAVYGFCPPVFATIISIASITLQKITYVSWGYIVLER